jgi:hypothetical protein
MESRLIQQPQTFSMARKCFIEKELVNFTKSQKPVVGLTTGNGCNRWGNFLLSPLACGPGCTTEFSAPVPLNPVLRPDIVPSWRYSPARSASPPVQKW